MGLQTRRGLRFRGNPFPLKASVTGLRYIYTRSKIASAKIKQAHHGNGLQTISRLTAAAPLAGAFRQQSIAIRARRLNLKRKQAVGRAHHDQAYA